MRTSNDDKRDSDFLELADRWLERHTGFLQAALWLFSLVVGCLQTWAYHDAMVGDGMNYLDVADAYLRGDWAGALNAYWSPLFSWILAVPLCLFRPDANHETYVVHATLLVIYIAAMACFAFFLRRAIEASEEDRRDDGTVSLPRWAWLAAGYSLFLWSTVELISFRMVTPDLCVTALTYLAAGLMLQIITSRGTWPSFAALGAVLALAYLTKAVMFICALFFLAPLPFLSRGANRASKTLLAVACFALVAGPFIGALSLQKGRLTFGDAGKLNYAWFVNQTTLWSHWQGDDPGTGTPKHPTRRLHDSPPLYEFAEPVGGTYPPSYDPSYWHEGLQVRPNWKRQVVTVLRGLDQYFGFFWESNTALPMMVLALALLAGGSQFRRGLLRQWPLLLPGLGGLGIFMLVRVENRYCAAFIVLLIVACLSAARLRETPFSRRMLAGVALAFCITICGTVGYRSVCMAGLEFFRPGTTTGDCGKTVAGELRKRGLRTGDRVGIVANGYEAYWARLAGVKIVAEIPGKHLESFWGADDATRTRLLELFRSAGARAVVSATLPLHREPDGWTALGPTGYCIRFLRE